MGRRGQAPDDACNGQADPHPHFVGESAHAGVTDRIRDAEGKDDLAELALAEMQITLDGRLQHAEQVPIHVVDRRHDEEQRDDHPSIVPAAGQLRGARRGDVICGISVSSRSLMSPDSSV